MTRQHGGVVAQWHGGMVSQWGTCETQVGGLAQGHRTVLLGESWSLTWTCGWGGFRLKESWKNEQRSQWRASSSVWGQRAWWFQGLEYRPGWELQDTNTVAAQHQSPWRPAGAVWVLTTQCLALRREDLSRYLLNEKRDIQDVHKREKNPNSF